MKIVIVLNGGAQFNVDTNENPILIRKDSIIVGFEDLKDCAYEIDILKTTRAIFPIDMVERIVLCQKS